MTEKLPDLKKIQRRIANVAIAPSTVRGQPAGTVDIIREFLASLNLQKFKMISSENEFTRHLNYLTKKLQKRLLKECWGIARKSLNVFLELAFFDRHLAEEYNLIELADFLELPYDSYTKKGIKKKADIYNLKNEWEQIKNECKSIKKFQKETNIEFQKIAKKIAEKEGLHRVYLDILFWRAK
mgnify:CR=1 FL=1